MVAFINYSQKKFQRELAKKKQKEQKLRSKLEKKNPVDKDAVSGDAVGNIDQKQIIN